MEVDITEFQVYEEHPPSGQCSGGGGSDLLE